MTLKELLNLHSVRSKKSVPDWLLGCFRRHSITFGNGLADTKMQVYWLQSRNFTIDIRLPIDADLVAAKQLASYTRQELEQLANYEGFSANTNWDGEMLSWQAADASLQIHNRWTEPALLKRVGNCMVEFCPSNAYIEDWRLQPSKPGPLIGLRLIEELELDSGLVRHKGGGLIVCGDYAGLTLGRAQTVVKSFADVTLNAMVEQADKNMAIMSQLFNFETSVAKGSLKTGFSIFQSTQPSRVTSDLFPLDGFEQPSKYQDIDLGVVEVIRQKLTIDGKACERLFLIDTLESDIVYSQTTSMSAETEAWFERESSTLTRYTEVLS
ncbi:MAG: hypothetical protein ABL880_03390 [Methylotenera sp.]